MIQTANPLRFWCAPNESTPDYVIYHDFQRWVAYGLLECWLGTDAGDPNSDCYFEEPVTHEHVDELRCYFLDLVETVIVTLWNGDYKPGDGEIQGDWQTVFIGEDDMLTWYIRLDDDAMMFELCCTGSDPVCIWLSYDAIEDREHVVAVLTEARQTVSDSTVWDRLLEAA